PAVLRRVYFADCLRERSESSARARGFTFERNRDSHCAGRGSHATRPSASYGEHPDWSGRRDTRAAPGERISRAFAEPRREECPERWPDPYRLSSPGLRGSRIRADRRFLRAHTGAPHVKTRLARDAE